MSDDRPAEPARTDDTRLRETGDATPSADAPRCDLCGAPLLEWNCRLICTACGFQRDCSDP